MKKTLLPLLLAAVVCGGLFVERARADGDDTVQINTLYQQFATACRHKDLNAIMAVYQHSNTLFVFDVGIPREHVGWQSYYDDWKAVLASIKGTPTFSISELGMTISGDVAYTHSIQTMTGNIGKLHSLVVRVTDILRKIDGRWLIVEEHVSVPINFNTLKPDFTSAR